MSDNLLLDEVKRLRRTIGELEEDRALARKEITRLWKMNQDDAERSQAALEAEHAHHAVELARIMADLRVTNEGAVGDKNELLDRAIAAGQKRIVADLRHLCGWEAYPKTCRDADPEGRWCQVCRIVDDIERGDYAKDNE